jgi:hypothetical protein
MGTEAVVACFSELCQCLTGGTKEDHAKLRSEIIPRTSRIRSRGFGLELTLE